MEDSSPELILKRRVRPSRSRLAVTTGVDGSPHCAYRTRSGPACERMGMQLADRHTCEAGHRPRGQEARRAERPDDRDGALYQVEEGRRHEGRPCLHRRGPVQVKTLGELQLFRVAGRERVLGEEARVVDEASTDGTNGVVWKRFSVSALIWGVGKQSTYRGFESFDRFPASPSPGTRGKRVAARG